MITDSLQDLVEVSSFKSKTLTKRELCLLEGLIKLIQEKLNSCLRKEEKYLELDFRIRSEEEVSGKATHTSAIELLFTVYHSSCRLIVSSTLALEIANRYLDKALPVVVRDLNQEELSIVALVATLVISELRDSGYGGIYLKTVQKVGEVSISNRAIIVEETNSKQTLIIDTEEQISLQLQERAKLILRESLIESVMLKATFLASLAISGEVKSLSTLFKLRPGAIWNLGQHLSPAVELNGEIIGYGDLIIKETN